MKIYRVHYRKPDFESEGYTYHSNKMAADKAKKEYAQQWDVDVECEIEERDIVIGKVEFLKLLNEWASHPDNG